MAPTLVSLKLREPFSMLLFPRIKHHPRSTNVCQFSHFFTLPTVLNTAYKLLLKKSVNSLSYPFVFTVVLNKNPDSMFNPQACNQVTSCMPSIAPTKHPFQSKYTGSENNNPKPATTRRIIPIDPIIFSISAPCFNCRGRAKSPNPYRGFLGHAVV